MIRQDFRYALRWFRRNPGFTLAALGVLALAIGATTATFCVVHSVALRPLPFGEPDRLVRIWSTQIRANVPFFSVSIPDFEDWRTQSRTLARLGAYTAQRSVVLEAAEREVVTAASVSGDLFPLLAVAPALGRWIGPEDVRPGAAQVAVVSHGLWQRRLGGRADVLGKALALDGRPLTIVGVMPAQFAIPNNPAEVWLPLQDGVDPTERGNRFLRVVGRLRPGANMDDARADLARVADDLGARYPDSNRGWSVTLRPIEETVVSPELRRALLLLVGAVVLVMIVACANVAGLLLSRAAARRREMAVRTALGASRRALFRQLLIEGLVLGAASGALGVLIAVWTVDGLARIAVNTIPRADEIAFRPAVVAVAFAATAATAILFSLAPALDLSRFTLGSLRARESSPLAGAARSRDALVLAELTLAVILLVGAGLLTRSFIRLQDRDLGFEADRLVVLQFAAPEAPAARRAGTHAALRSGLSAAPGVEQASGVLSAPFSGRNPGNVFTIVGRPVEPGEPPPNTDFRLVTAGYLRTMRIPIVRGRDLLETDGPPAPAVVLSESAMRRYWPDADPLGARIRFGPHTLTIVGIASDARYAALDAPTDDLRPMMYLPHTLMPDTPLEFVVRTRLPPEAAVPGVRAAALAAAPDMPIARLSLMTHRLADARGPHRFYTTVLGAFAWIALLLAAAGLWSVIAYGVARRTREIGIRVALGARPADVLRMAAGRGMILALAGVALGLASAASLSRLLERLLYGIGATDGLTFAAIGASFLTVATAASVLPARRALRIEPAEALRSE